ncbi:NAD(P)H-dependent oxidoreductase [Sulfurimonas aquatica]|uniref:NAD(P)H-dependent oxidoreductase n=1 Tax=Sulfurimonas aquatica TaxID=2672570 RepID=A0A975AYS6_9BACT|nr:NAD(P)H-dependent oxidoreductase [Sulfurimonas aquatica]QSZ41087.1 NAD(P)H-dependent oxidoreductase [Sulfurimonas aquatica]
MENKFLDAMTFRHACKEFDSTKKISDDDFNAILEIGRISPSSFGFEPWKFVIVQNEVLREKLKEFSWGAQGQLPTASHFMIILSRKKNSMMYDSEYIEHILKDVKQLPQDVVEMYGQFYEKFIKEDFKLLESERTLFDWATKQTYIPLANMMTGAAYMGIDSCPIEGFDAQKTEDFLRDELKIDTEEFGAAVMLAFGYRKDEPSREKARQEMDSITQWYN